MKHRGRIHFAMALSSFEHYSLEHFTTGLHLQVEFGCRICHEKLGDACGTVVNKVEDEDAQESEEEEDEAGFHMPICQPDGVVLT